MNWPNKSYLLFLGKVIVDIIRYYVPDPIWKIQKIMLDHPREGWIEWQIKT